MGIQYSEKERLFTLETEHSTYQMQVGAYGHLLHLYYGRKVQGNMNHLLVYADRGFSGNPYDAGKDRTYSMDVLPQEYSSFGNGDYRTSALVIQNADGSHSCDLRYHSYEILEGKYAIPGLPAVYDSSGETLKIILEDAQSGIRAVLYYGVLSKYDVITRAAEIKNQGKREAVVEKAASACLDFLTGSFACIDFYGRHAMERNMQRHPLSHGLHSIGSSRGTSSHQYNPFMILCDQDATEDAGDCYGMSLVYSGEFKGEAELDQFGQTRMVMGIQDERFAYPLGPGESFYTPEVVLSYSREGLSKLSLNYHKTYRYNLCRGKYKTEKRPVLINNWEATYFDFTGEKIYEIAKQAAELGVEMLVLDDGWFGKRDSDESGLGDWFVNEEKMEGTMEELAAKINELGMKFGIWIEPEMVSEDSRLYREHPDWAFAVPGRKPVRSRHQLVLDFSRKEVVDYIFHQLTQVLDSANIEYIKWDMNRSLMDAYSAVADKSGQGAVLYRYVLGVYDLLERLNQRYPDMLIEGCSGGGGRFDAGMLYYTPQIWCSDNTDAIDRLRIQYGTSFGYPISAVGSHVSAVPNHQTGRSVSMETRGTAAMAGSFGYELDLNKITEKEKECVKKQIQDYHKYWNVIHNGDYYRLTNPFQNQDFAAWEFVSEDQDEVLIQVVTLTNHGNPPVNYLKCKGLDAQATYQEEETGRIYSGSGLMYAGLPIPFLSGDYRAWQISLKRR